MSHAPQRKSRLYACALRCIVSRTGLTIRGPHTNVRRGPFSHTRSQDFLWGASLGCTFLPPKVDDFLCVVVTFKPTLNVQTSQQRGKNLVVDRGASSGVRGAPMVEPAQWLIRPCLFPRVARC